MGLEDSEKIGGVILVLFSFLEIAPEVAQGVKTGKIHTSGPTARIYIYDYTNCR